MIPHESIQSMQWAMPCYVSGHFWTQDAYTSALTLRVKLLLWKTACTRQNNCTNAVPICTNGVTRNHFFGGSDATACLHVKIWLWTYLRTSPDWPTLQIVMPYCTTEPPNYIWTYYTSKVWYDYDWYKLQVWHNTRQNDLYRDKEMRTDVSPPLRRVVCSAGLLGD